MTAATSQLLDTIVRALALAAGGAALLVLLTHWAVRRRQLTPFGWWPRFVRSWSDPLLRPVERRLHGAGANPQDAPVWLLGITLVLGLLAITAERWVLNGITLLASMQHAGPRAWLRLAVRALTSLLTLAIIVRVVASWLGAGRYRRWMRPWYWLTDWIVEPIRRRLPPVGLLDLSPFIAYAIILVARGLLLGAL